MHVTRDKLYAEVWAEPMVVVAKRYDVSSTYLARICEELNVPRPPRGYWQQLKVGKAVEQPALPDARPGDEVEWGERGGYRIRRNHLPEPREPRAARPRSARPKRHTLLVDAREHFGVAAEDRDQLLKPSKRLLADVVVSKALLERALDTANELYLTLEDRGHDVVFAPRDQALCRVEPQFIDGREFGFDRRWYPARPTVVFVRGIAIGLTIFEPKESVDGRYTNGGWKRLTELPAPPRRPARFAPYQSEIMPRQLPSGRLALHAYAPHPGVTWEKYWYEESGDGLSGRVDAIAVDLEAVVPDLRRLAEEARKKADEEHQEALEQHRRWEREERERRRARAIAQSRNDLIELAGTWNEACRLEKFLRDVAQAAAALDPTARAELEERVRRARDLVGTIDAVAHFERWRTPDEM